ncbi:MAG TPA: hypothetical protein VIM81_12525 [Gammaproteobacteria bacterium]
MKLRIRGNTLRLRVSKSELTEISTRGIEKDFECLHPRAGEDDSDLFANPDKGAP